jgi:hypothetical protein
MDLYFYDYVRELGMLSRSSLPRNIVTPLMTGYRIEYGMVMRAGDAV